MNTNKGKVTGAGDTILKAISQISNKRVEQASFDKSYFVTVLGVNSKFTTDISDEDKQSLIAKYSIPEKVENGESNCYTIRINGAYYVIRQKGGFKLYDKVMVYIPNGDWSRMYLDYPSTDNSKASHLSIPFMQSTDPASIDSVNVLNGDYWIKLSDDNDPDSCVAMYKRIGGLWELVDDSDLKTGDGIFVKVLKGGNAIE